MRNRGDPKTSKQVLEKSMKENIRGSLKSMGLSLEARILPLMVNWKESMGKPACESTRPYCYRRIHRQLVIKVKNNSWSQELSLQQTQLLKRLKSLKIVFFHFLEAQHHEAWSIYTRVRFYQGWGGRWFSLA